MGTITTISHCLANEHHGKFATGTQQEIAFRLCDVTVEERKVTARYLGQIIHFQEYTGDWTREEMVKDASKDIVRKLQANGFTHYRQIQ